MSSISNEAKLAELRAKTDSELSGYLTRELNLGFHLAAEGDDDSYMHAEAVYAVVAKLLPLLHDLDPSEFSRMELRVERLREILDAQRSWRTGGAVRSAVSVS